jgi:hypothetical protein
MKTFKETFVILALALPLVASANEPAESFSSYPMFSETIRGLNGIHFDGKLGLGYAKDIWMDPIESDDGTKKKMVSKSGKMALEFNGIDEYRDEVITWSKAGEVQKAAVTVFKDKRPESHTFVLGGEGYTINSHVCEILRQQTNSKSMSDLAARSKTCGDFYKTKAIPAKVLENIKDLEQTHTANVQRLRNSVAKDIFPKAEVPVKKSEADSKKEVGPLDKWMMDYAASVAARSESPKPMPRSAKDIFSAKTFKDGTSYREALAGVGDACAKFYPSAAPAPAAARPATPASGAATAK